MQDLAYLRGQASGIAQYVAQRAEQQVIEQRHLDVAAVHGIEQAGEQHDQVNALVLHLFPVDQAAPQQTMQKATRQGGAVVEAVNRQLDAFQRRAAQRSQFIDVLVQPVNRAVDAGIGPALEQLGGDGRVAQGRHGFRRGIDHRTLQYPGGLGGMPAQLAKVVLETLPPVALLQRILERFHPLVHGDFPRYLRHCPAKAVQAAISHGGQVGVVVFA